MKRTLDLLVVVPALLIFSPLLLLAMLAIRVESPGSALFAQTRVGLGGRTFKMYKLRSMVKDASALGGHSTAEGDPRITRVGAFLRKTSIDELPQLFNVLCGDMSLVGPRPDTPMQQTDYDAADWQRRVSVKPGITGLSQAKLRSAATFEQRLKLDLEYVERHDLWLDLFILWETIRRLARSKAF